MTEKCNETGSQVGGESGATIAWVSVWPQFQSAEPSRIRSERSRERRPELSEAEPRSESRGGRRSERGVQAVQEK